MPDKNSPEYVENYNGMQSLVANLQSHVEKAHAGGGETAVKRHISKGKLLVRDRINCLLDPGTPFLELSQLAAHNMYQPDFVPAAGVVTGIGRISG